MEMVRKLKDVTPFSEQELLEYARLYYCGSRSADVESLEEIPVMEKDDEHARLFATVIQLEDRRRRIRELARK